MPQYAILIYAPAPGDVADMPPEEMEAHLRHAEEAERLGGQVVQGFALKPSTGARSVRGTHITDGPFTEAKEVIAGFYILQARDAEHALEIAKRNPATRRGGVEIRELMV
jgi:hypothetical protein